MTTIAYSARHRSIAADRLATSNGTRIGYVRKIMQVGPLLIGGCGASAFITPFMAWVRRGMVGQCPSMSNHVSGDQSLDAMGVILWDEMCLSFIDSGPQRVYGAYHAFGSGAEFASGALEAGATPEEAVRVAIVHDINSGGDVDVITLP